MRGIKRLFYPGCISGGKVEWFGGRVILECYDEPHAGHLIMITGAEVSILPFSIHIVLLNRNLFVQVSLGDRG